MEANRILIAAAGTGGHVFPGLAVATELKKMHQDVLWVGTASGMESHLVPEHDITFFSINAKGLRGKGLVARIKGLLGLVSALWQSFKLLYQLKPNVVLCMGGYISGPVGLVARLRGIPLIVHEQNAIAGTTNKILARFSSWNLQAFPNVFGQKNTTTVGNPLRNVFQNNTLKPEGSSTKLHVLVVGGSLGAQAINDLMPEVYLQLQHDIALWHQAGKHNIDSTLNQYDEQGLKLSSFLRVDAFIADMAEAYTWADIVICRSGAMTVSELAAAGKPAILIPFPYAIDDHQTANAKWLTEQGAAELIPQNQISVSRLVDILSELNQHKDRLSEMGHRAKAMATFHATQKVAEKCLELAL